MKIIVLLISLFLVFSGCASVSEKERLLEEGTFVEKIAYLEKNYSDKDEVAEFFGPPDKVKDFQGYSSLWTYENTEKPLEILFGRDDTLMRIDFKSKSRY